MKVLVVFDIQDYVTYSTAGRSAVLSSRQRALLSSCFALMLERENWMSMTNAQWDVLESELAEIFGVLNA